MSVSAAARGTPPSVHAFIGLLAALATWLTVTTGPVHAPVLEQVPALAAFLALLIVAEYLFVRFRYGGEINSLNLIEAVIAPLIVAFDGPIAVVTVTIAQIIAAVLRRNAPVKAAFNVAQWALMAAVGSAVFTALSGPGDEISLSTAGALFAAMAVMGLVNQTAFTTVLAMVNRKGPREVLLGVLPVIVPGWLLGWTINALIGLLFVFAYAAHPVAVVLFPVPLAVLHFAYRGYAGARSDRVRLSGLHRAARILASPLDPQDAIAPFLLEVAESFEARAAALVLADEDALIVHRVDHEHGGAHSIERRAPGSDSLESALMQRHGPFRLGRDTPGALAAMLVEAGWRDCLSAPLVEEERVIGRLIVYDQAAFEGFEAGELAVIEALARETAGTFTKGRLLTEILEERRKLSEIVTSTSDGILTLTEDGTVRSWNPGMEKITGLAAANVVNVPGALARLSARSSNGAPVALERWTEFDTLPAELRITAGDGVRRLSCSYSHATDEAGSTRTLVVIVRDVTPADEMEALRKQFGRLAEAEAAQRTMVEQLQEAVMPARPRVADTEFAVSYLASDPSAPTGGDLYDWSVLPSGDVHIAVVDVLGHGVSATKDALSIVHALRLLALQGTPLQDMIGRADALLGSHNPDLVATAIVARYDPATGVAELAAGGHPPALLASGTDGVSQLPVSGGAIGWPRAGSDGVARVQLSPGDALILYTDGLVEARKDIIAGTEALMRHAAELRERPADEMAAGLMQRSIWGADRRDDSVVLVVRRTEPARAAWTTEPAPEHVRDLRHAAASWLAEHGVGTDATDDLVLITSELLTNAMHAARTKIELRLMLDGDRISLEVEDDGPGETGLERVGREAPPRSAEAGRGLFIVRKLMDEVEIETSSRGSVVRALRALRPDERHTAARSDAARDARPQHAGA